MTFYGFGQKRSIFYGHKILIIISYHFYGFLWLRTNPDFTNNNLFSSQQYGFRKNASTELAALELIDRLLTRLKFFKYL